MVDKLWHNVDKCSEEASGEIVNFDGHCEKLRDSTLMEKFKF